MMDEIERVEIRPEIDEVLDALSHRHRREILRYFEANSNRRETNVSALVDHLCSDTTESERQQIRLQLRHTHLPKLENTQCLEYDPNQRRVRYTGQTDVGRMLDAIHEIVD